MIDFRKVLKPDYEQYGPEEQYEVVDVKTQSLEYFGTLAITAVYKGARLVWTAVRSCFGKGYWINEKPWLNDDAWKN